MGQKIMWGGVVCILALSHFWPVLEIVGDIVTPVGYVLYLFDK